MGDGVNGVDGVDEVDGDWGDDGVVGDDRDDGVDGDDRVDGVAGDFWVFLGRRSLFSMEPMRVKNEVREDLILFIVTVCVF